MQWLLGNEFPDRSLATANGRVVEGQVCLVTLGQFKRDDAFRERLSEDVREGVCRRLRRCAAGPRACEETFQLNAVRMTVESGGPQGIEQKLPPSIEELGARIELNG